MKPRLNWMNVTTLLLSPILAIVGVALYLPAYGIGWAEGISFLVLYLGTGLAITGGYHRYYSHRAYECHPWVEFLFLCFGAASLQNSALHWVSDHRNHHRYVDGERDPYSIKRGFFWAHMGWIFYQDPSGTEDFSNVRDLMKRPMVRWQHQHFYLIAALVGFGLPALIGWMFGNALGGLLFGGLVRLVLGHHATFLINSAAHWTGAQPHSHAHSAKDNFWLALISFGEGYHNFHHTYPSDYRNGVAWYQWDVTKWLISSLERVGLAWGLRRTAPAASLANGGE